mmetsp:Transcript_6305/g.9076  ORF Transcript_6305/g.9076 Transcript_6305/m.9076 type:complete len:201 (+) Transcript_6305:97-699(+)|eukprot:CAMPEP_0202449772 /NCGR_PEP_ID=MMETSP1360-20130828/8476_1 /ASSEMBLY_ACC=CAM_ASM_000848 /TAXON_ID=515479 /ORGANISM="Licmophora paradoxa, Strain CCMP2313" /LENGTH=200 /DNA_ID=CAMNT_0049067809 /DNA_START=75 /DNA_END=677 /DNA_ORIENTATION=+
MRNTCMSMMMLGSAAGFAVVPTSQQSSTELRMGLFDGVKDAFSAPALERSTLDAERETPIDRWMGWSVSSENQPAQQAAPIDFIDAMDSTNYVTVELEKPMGIVFEENDEEFGGIFVQELKEGGIAAVNGILLSGDQLVAVGTTKVAGMPFDEALGAIVDSSDSKTKLTLFRGTAKQLYGPTGASQEWLDEFCAAGGVEA